VYKFNVNLLAPASLKEKIVWVLYLGLLFFFLYGSANQFASLTSPHPSIVFEWEKQIPFVDGFIFPYMSSDLIFVMALMLPQTRLELKVLAVRIAFLILVSCLIFVLFPLSSSFAKPENVEYQFLFEILKADLSYNQIPSLHVSLAIVLFDAFRRCIKNNLARICAFIWMLLICLSTLLVYQHHFIDIPAAIFLAFATIKIFSYQAPNRITKKFTTPRGLKIGIYYLILSIIFTAFAFFVNKLLAVVFIYLFLSMLLISLSYAFGFFEIMEQKKYFFLLLPYFFVNHLSWLYFKNKLPLYQELSPNIYFGRMPTKQEYEQLKALGITVFINLAHDLKFNFYYKSTKSINFLDMTIQDPQQLENLYQYMKENQQHKIYIHCKFGLSRTIIAMMYYLYKEKNVSYKESIAKLQAMHPVYKLKAYMLVNAKLYQEEN
jgi:protein-tyrosine phosphatase/membrane-associated phospholipid phosphatase